MMGKRPIERRHGAHLGIRIARERAVHSGCNGRGGEDPKALTAASLPWLRNVPHDSVARGSYRTGHARRGRRRRTRNGLRRSRDRPQLGQHAVRDIQIPVERDER